MKPVPFSANKLSQVLKALGIGFGTPDEHFAIPDIWLINNIKGLQISYCDDGSGENGPIGFTVMDAVGETIYLGTSEKEAVKKIQDYLKREDNED
jgi:hypothetical protein